MVFSDPFAPRQRAGPSLGGGIHHLFNTRGERVYWSDISDPPGYVTARVPEYDHHPVRTFEVEEFRMLGGDSTVLYRDSGDADSGNPMSGLFFPTKRPNFNPIANKYYHVRKEHGEPVTEFIGWGQAVPISASPNLAQNDTPDPTLDFSPSPSPHPLDSGSSPE